MPANHPNHTHRAEPKGTGKLRPARKKLRSARQSARTVEVELGQLEAELDRAEAGPTTAPVQVPPPAAVTMTLPFPATPPEPFFTVTSGSDSPADAPNAVLDVPHWDADTRTLTWQGRVVKRFRVRAVNQEPILAAFQELGWPPRIDDPLPRPKGRDPKVRLRDTVRSLNHRQQFSGLRFEADGTGTGVCWRPA